MDNTLGDAIKTRRKELKLSQQELADALNGRQATVSNIESGVKVPELETLLNLASALSCRFVIHSDRSITMERE